MRRSGARDTWACGAADPDVSWKAWILTPTEMTDKNEAAEQQSEVVANSHDHKYEHEHEHDHEHTHQHAPSLNPELTREIEVEVGADEVSKSFKTVVKRYQKLA